MPNLRKTNIFIENHCKTLEKPRFPLKIIEKPMENQYFQWKSLKNQWKTNISIQNHSKTFGKPIFSLKIIEKTLENQCFHWQSLRNLRNNNIFIQNHCKTLGKHLFSMKIIAKVKENKYFHWKSTTIAFGIDTLHWGQWHWTVSICICQPVVHWHRAIAIGPLPLAHWQTILINSFAIVSNLIN